MTYKLTPINDDYESCYQCHAAFSFRAENSFPLVKEFTKLGLTYTSRDGVYLFSTENIIISKDLRVHLDFLLKKLYLLKYSIKKLKNLKSDCKLSCTWLSYGSGGPVLWPCQLQMMAELDLACSFQFIYINSDSKKITEKVLYNTNEDYHVEILVYPSVLGFNPTSITHILGIQPTELNIKGTEIINTLGLKRLIKRSSWILSSVSAISSTNLVDHMNWLLEKLKYALPKLGQLQSQGDIIIFIKYVWYTSQGASCETISAEQIKLMASFDIEYAFDIYFDSSFL